MEDLHARVLKLEQKLKKVSESLESRKAVEKAKWMLVQKYGISEEEAYEKTREKSMDIRMSMKSIAEALLLSHGRQ